MYVFVCLSHSSTYAQVRLGILVTYIIYTNDTSQILYQEAVEVTFVRW